MAIVNWTISSPRRTCHSTPDSAIATRRITLLLEPSFFMAKDRVLAVDCRHSFFVMPSRLGSLNIAIDIRAPGVPDGEGLPYHHTLHGYREHLSPFLGVPALNDDSCHQVFLVLVTHLLKEAGCRVSSGGSVSSTLCKPSC